jgi:hypothetical protein
VRAVYNCTVVPRWFSIATVMSIVLLIGVALPGGTILHTGGHNFVHTVLGSFDLSDDWVDMWSCAMIALMILGVLLPPVWVVLWMIEKIRTSS